MSKRINYYPSFKRRLKSGVLRCGKVYKNVLVDRDKCICQICGIKKSIIVHHLDGNKNNNVENNLLTVCKSCHAELHGHKKDHKYIKEIIELRKNGNSYQAIGDKFNLSRQRIHQIISKLPDNLRPKVEKLDKVCYNNNMSKSDYKTVIIRLFLEQYEQLRKLSYLRHESQSKIIRDLFDDFYNKPKEVKNETNR